MRISTKTRYGTRLMLDLAKNHGNGYIQLREIANRQDLSVKYLEQIILPLKKAKLVTSIRGARGGHMLAKNPAEITVGEIVSLLEDGPHFVACSDLPQTCAQADTCVTRHVWKEAAEAMYANLNKITLADLIKRENQMGTEEGTLGRCT